MKDLNIQTLQVQETHTKEENVPNETTNNNNNKINYNSGEAVLCYFCQQPSAGKLPRVPDNKVFVVLTSVFKSRERFAY